MKTFSLAAAGLLAITALAGCSRSEPDEAPPTENAVTDETPPPVEETRAPEPAPAPAEPAPAPSANAATPPPAPAVAPDEQMLDDADATGMTARSSRDEPTTDAPANETETK